MTRRAWSVVIAGALLTLLLTQLGGCAPVTLQVLIVPIATTTKPVPVRPVEAASAQDKALAKEWRELAAKWAQSPTAKEVLNQVGQPGNVINVERLAGEKPGTPEEMAFARNYLVGRYGYLPQMRRLKDWPVLREYAIRQAARVIQGDAMDDGALWAAAEEIVIDYPVREHERVKGKANKAVCRMLWDAQALHVFFQVSDGEVISSFKVRDQPVWQTDCVELFVVTPGALASEKPAYWEINVNPAGVVYDALNFKSRDEWGGVLDTTYNAVEMRVFSRPTATGYWVQISLPWSCVRGLPGPAEKGTVLWMLAGWADKTGKEHTQYLSHTPILGWFHNIWGYSKFVLQ